MIDTVEIMQVVLHAYKIYDKEVPITYELWYKLIQYVLTMSPNLEESPGTLNFQLSPGTSHQAGGQVDDSSRLFSTRDT